MTWLGVRAPLQQIGAMMKMYIPLIAAAFMVLTIAGCGTVPNDYDEDTNVITDGRFDFDAAKEE